MTKSARSHEPSIWKIEGLIFDMDGVITDTMPDHFRSWHKVLGEAGLRVSRHDIYKREGQRGIQSIREFFAEKQVRISQSRARNLLRRKESLFKKSVRPRFIRGARRFLKRLHRQGIPLALVTGTSRRETNQILPEPLRILFAHIITGNDTRQGKPHPAPYRKALRLMRAQARNTAVIENAPLGIRSAKSAGCRCIALTSSLPTEYLHEADRIFDSFSTLTRRICFEHHAAQARTNHEKS